MQIVEAHAPQFLPTVRALFTEYADAIKIDLCFQNFDRELAELPGYYAPPGGRLFLAMKAEVAVGCVAVRKIGDGICEMKRLYVCPQHRGHGLGRTLAVAAIQAARDIGYARMRLDTLSSMTEAITLYGSLGFQRITAYYDNPSGCAVFMELKLR